MAAPSLTVAVQPQQNGSVVYLPLAPPTDGADDNAQLSLILRIRNDGDEEVRLTTMTYSFQAPPSVPMKTITFAADFTLAPGEKKVWRHGPADNVLLPVPAPTSLTLSISCDGLSEPDRTMVPLASFDSTLPDDAYRFPARAADLADGEYWEGRSAAHSAAGGSTQIFGYDMDVQRYDEESKQWTRLVPGGDKTKNEDYLIWGKPVVAMAEGKVQSFANDIPTNPTPTGGDLSPPQPLEGNHFYIQHGEALVMYAHMQPGSLTPELMSPGADVYPGTVLGLAGNSGNSTNPHLHISAISGKKPWNGPPSPVPWRGISTIARDKFTPPAVPAPWVVVDAQGLPSVASLVNPHGLPRWVLDERAIDPLALILAQWVYVRLTLPDPPPWDRVLERARVKIREMPDAERQALRRRMELLHNEVKELADDLKPEH
ncbi:MAG TPA: M23 family metallopeptidase [Thermoleophilaceae bacterium]|nr:M23 family metallopeptidase [Thermoleophilaceae bacterium]